MFIRPQAHVGKTILMAIGLIFAAAMLGQAEVSAATAPSQCSPAVPDPNSSQIVICAPKPQGYRIDPDVLEAKRAKKEALAGRHKAPENYKDHSCVVVGPAPCMDAPTVNLLGAVATAAEMAERLAKGEDVGSMFVTDPQPTEYQLYLEAKKRRAAKAAEAAAQSVRKAAQSAGNAP
jgi:hypothetical protein